MKNRIFQFILLRKYRIALILADVVFINLAVYLSTFLLKTHPTPAIFYLFATFSWFAVSVLFLLYSVLRYAVRYIGPAIIIEWIILNLAVFYIDTFIVARKSLVLMLPFMVVFILGNRLLFRWVKSLRTKKEKGGKIKTLILGVDDEACEIAELLERDRAADYDIVGFLNIDNQNIKVDNKRILGDIEGLYKIAKTRRINEVIIALPSYTPQLHKKIERIVKDYYELGISFKVSGRLFGNLVGRLKMKGISDYFLIDILTETDNSRYLIYKRLFDITISSLGLLFLSPVMLLIALILKFYEKGPVFFRHERIGESGQPFILYKFRSMVPEASRETSPARAHENDERITPFGRFLRRNSFDELPQLCNVLKGDMSLVGPRPEMTYFVNNHKELRGKRLNVKPGITGLAQINGRQNLSPRQKVKYDYIYLKHCTFALDMKILLKTCMVVLNKEGVR